MYLKDFLSVLISKVIQIVLYACFLEQVTVKKKKKKWWDTLRIFFLPFINQWALLVVQEVLQSKTVNDVEYVRVS